MPAHRNPFADSLDPFLTEHGSFNNAILSNSSQKEEFAIDGFAQNYEASREEELLEEPEHFYDNLAEYISQDSLNKLAMSLMEEYEDNKSSHQEWFESYDEGIKQFELYRNEGKAPLFEGASDINHTLLIEAATQFQAQAYKEVLPAGGPSKSVVVGSETTAKMEQARRIEKYMNYYILHKMPEYTPDTDQMLFYLPIGGSTFKKTYWDGALGRIVSRFVEAKDIIVPMDTTDLESCPNITQQVTMQYNDFLKHQQSGFYRQGVNIVPITPSQVDEEFNQGNTTEGNTTSLAYLCKLVECHVNVDLEGFENLDEEERPTGIQLPYIVTISLDTAEVLSIRRNYLEEDEFYKKIPYFTHFKFLPGTSFYGHGLIHTIGDLAAAASSIMRQLIDAGTLANCPMLIKSKGLPAPNEGDTLPVQPATVVSFDAPSGDIRDSIMSLPFKGPNQTLMALLGFVVDAGRRFAAITDLKVGDGDQSAAVGTTVAMIEQGSRVMSAIHKRYHYSMGQELKILARLLSQVVPQEYPYSIQGEDATIYQSDFDDRIDILPVSDPNIFSQTQRVVLAQTVLQLASSDPLLYNRRAVHLSMLESLGVQDPDKFLKSKSLDETKPVDPAQENMNALDLLPLTAFKGQNHDAHITAHLLLGTNALSQASPEIAMGLQKHLYDHAKLKAQEQTEMRFEEEVKTIPELNQAEPETLKMLLQHRIAGAVSEELMKMREQSQKLSGAGAPDPLLEIKKQEVEQRGKKDEMTAEIAREKLRIDGETLPLRKSQGEQRIASSEKQTEQRLTADAAKEQQRAAQADRRAQEATQLAILRDREKAEAERRQAEFDAEVERERDEFEAKAEMDKEKFKAAADLLKEKVKAESSFEEMAYKTKEDNKAAKENEKIKTRNTRKKDI